MTDLLVNYCPRCGSRVMESIINSLGNGGDWDCGNCGSYVEAYVLNRGDIREEESE